LKRVRNLLEEVHQDYQSLERAISSGGGGGGGGVGGGEGELGEKGKVLLLQPSKMRSGSIKDEDIPTVRNILHRVSGEREDSESVLVLYWCSAVNI